MADLLDKLSIYAVIIPLITGILLWKLQEVNARIMVLLMAFASFTQIFPEFFPASRCPVYNLYIFIDVLLWSFMFIKSVRLKIAKAFIILLLLSFTFIFSYYIYNNGGIDKEFHSGLVCLDSVFQVLCVLIYFYERYNAEQILNLEKEAMFWFCIAILIYAPCTYLRFALLSSKITFANLNTFHSILNILLYVLITIGLAVNFSTSKIFNPWIKQY